MIVTPSAMVRLKITYFHISELSWKQTWLTVCSKITFQKGFHVLYSWNSPLVADCRTVQKKKENGRCSVTFLKIIQQNMFVELLWANNIFKEMLFWNYCLYLHSDKLKTSEMAIMQEDILKFGVRTRKRNKSIKESAKLVNKLSNKIWGRNL